MVLFVLHQLNNQRENKKIHHKRYYGCLFFLLEKGISSFSVLHTQASCICDAVVLTEGGALLFVLFCCVGGVSICVALIG